MNLSRIHPLFYHARIEQFRLQRTLQNLLISRKFARERAEASLPYTVKKHQSLLRRKLGDTDLTFQFRVWMTDRHLKGGIYSDRLTDYTYHVKETDHRFLEIDGKTCRENKLWRTVIDRRTGRQVGLEFIMHNFAEVKYRLDPAVLQTAADHNYGPDDARS